MRKTTHYGFTEVTGLSRNEVMDVGIRVASSGFETRVARRLAQQRFAQQRFAKRDGSESLYADPQDVLDRYKDFDIVEAMQDRRGANLLWARARAIDADTVNANGDYFSEEELLKKTTVKDVDGNESSIPAYKTFEGCPLYTNHKNDDIEQAKGMVVYAEWDDDQKCVWCTFFVDADAYPDIAQGIRVGYLHDVSMGCQVEAGICSVCDHKAVTERDYCKHLKDGQKGKTDPSTGKKQYEKNLGIKFIELSVVGDGAFETCEIKEIYDPEEIIGAAVVVERKASSVTQYVQRYAFSHASNKQVRAICENYAAGVTVIAGQANRLAQAAGTLVGGALLAGDGANNNATVGGILEYLGLDPKQGLNVLDLLNLALNFLEVSVMNLFARKDSIDLSHVGKITKAMSDLQNTMGDMIDDGVDMGGGSVGGGGAGGSTPLNQAQLGGAGAGGGQSAAPQGGGQAPSDYGSAGQVGSIMGPQGGAGGTAGGAGGGSNVHENALPLGGGALAFNARQDQQTRTALLSWDDGEPIVSSQRIASTSGGGGSIAPNRPNEHQLHTSNIERLLIAVGQLAMAINLPETERRGVSASVQRLSTRTSADISRATRQSQPNHQPTRLDRPDQNQTSNHSKTSHSGTAVSAAHGTAVNTSHGTAVDTSHGKAVDRRDTMQIFKRMANKQRDAKFTADAHFDDKRGYRVTLSTDGNIVGSFRGAKVQGFEPNLTDAQITLLEEADQDDTRVAQVATVLLASLREHAAAMRVAEWKPNNETEKNLTEQVGAKHKPNAPGSADKIREELLDDDAGDYGWQGEDDRIREETLADAGVYKNTQGSEDAVREELLGKAGNYANDNDPKDEVRELLLKGHRKGTYEDYLAQELENVRGNYGPMAVSLVTANTVEAMGRAVVAARVTPAEVIEAAQVLSSRKDLADLIATAAFALPIRNKRQARASFHQSPVVDPTAEVAVLFEIGAKIGKDVTAENYADALRHIASAADTAEKAVRKAATAILGDGDGILPAPIQRKATKADLYRAALANLASESDESESEIDAFKGAICAMAAASYEIKAHPKEVVAAVAGISATDLTYAIEMARSESAIELRNTARRRAAYYPTKRIASKTDVVNTVIGCLADYADKYSFTSAGIALAAVKGVSGKTQIVAEKMVASTITDGLRQAGISVTDEETTTRTINCRIEDLHGVDKNASASEFKRAFREQAISILQGEGFEVDPTTFTLTEVNVDSNGTITASIRTRFSKTSDVDSNGGSGNFSDGIDGGADSPLNGSSSEYPTAPSSSETDVVEPSSEVPMTITTAAFRNHRRQLRAAALGRYGRGTRTAQFSGGAPGGAGGTADPMAGGGGMAGGAPPEGPGMSSLSVPSELDGTGGDPTEDDTDSDGMSEPGKPQPWGTICPNCGSNKVDLANGSGTCQKCNAELEYSFSVVMKPDKKGGGADGDSDGTDGAGGDTPSLDDLGLGAATAPSAGGAAGAGAPPAGGAAGAPPASGMMMQASWEVDPEVFVRTGSKDFNRDKELALPVGMICGRCGNRHASKVKNRSYCYDCGSIMSTKITAGSRPDRVRVALRWMIQSEKD